MFLFTEIVLIYQDKTEWFMRLFPKSTLPKATGACEMFVLLGDGISLGIPSACSVKQPQAEDGPVLATGTSFPVTPAGTGAAATPSADLVDFLHCCLCLYLGCKRIINKWVLCYLVPCSLVFKGLPLALWCAGFQEHVLTSPLWMWGWSK